MATAHSVFAVDTNTGQVYIAGNLFVQSADKAGDGWIVGDMISASSVIELTDGAIVLDGQHGTVSVFDPDAPTSGTFTEISHGRVNQYVDGDLARSLTGVETGICENDTWVELTGRYTTLPRIIISPQNLQCFNSGYASQSQSFLCGVSATESLGANRWRFKPLAQLVAASGTTVIPGPASVVVQCENTSTPITYETNEVNTGENTIHIQCDAVLGGSVWEVNATIEHLLRTGILEWRGHLITNFIFNYYQAKMKARLCYRKTSTQAWTYCNWSAEQTLTYEQNATVQLGTSVPSGNYQVKVQFLLNAGSRTHDEYSWISTIESQQCQIPSFTITRASKTISLSGTLNYLAIGR